MGCSGFYGSGSLQRPRYLFPVAQRHMREPSRPKVRTPESQISSIVSKPPVPLIEEIRFLEEPGPSLVASVIEEESQTKHPDPSLVRRLDPAPIDEIRRYLLDNGHEVAGAANLGLDDEKAEAHARLLQDLSKEPELIGISSSEIILYRFEVGIFDSGLNGRGTHEDRLSRETDLVYLCNDGNLVLVECTTGSNGSARMKRQLQDAQDWWWIRKGIFTRAIACRRHASKLTVSELDYDPRYSEVNKTSY